MELSKDEQSQEALSNVAAEIPQELANARATIDNIDAALIHILAERFRCTQNVGLLKARLELPPTDSRREQEQIARLRKLAAESGLDPVFAEKFISFIIDEVIHHHEQIKADYAGLKQAQQTRENAS